MLPSTAILRRAFDLLPRALCQSGMCLKIIGRPQGGISRNQNVISLYVHILEVEKLKKPDISNKIQVRH